MNGSRVAVLNLCLSTPSSDDIILDSLFHGNSLKVMRTVHSYVFRCLIKTLTQIDNQAIFMPTLKKIINQLSLIFFAYIIVEYNNFFYLLPS